MRIPISATFAILEGMKGFEPLLIDSESIALANYTTFLQFGQSRRTRTFTTPPQMVHAAIKHHTLII